LRGVVTVSVLCAWSLDEGWQLWAAVARYDDLLEDFDGLKS